MGQIDFVDCSSQSIFEADKQPVFSPLISHINTHAHQDLDVDI